jgi:multidrug efflux pump subunit AcrA (membrane-fusion protein)
MTRRSLTSIAVAGALLLATLGLAGCGARAAAPADPASPAASVAATAPAASSATTTAPKAPGSAAATPRIKPAERSALDAELRAIEGELDGIDMPSDADMANISVK